MTKDLFKRNTQKALRKQSGVTWNCPCCMTSSDKPKLRRTARRKLKQLLIFNINEEVTA